VALGVIDRAAVLLQHQVVVECLVVVGGDDAGIQDVEPQLVQQGGDPGKQTVLVGAVEEYCAAAAIGMRPDRCPGQFMPQRLQYQPGLPGDLPGGVVDEEVVAESAPELGAAICVDTLQCQQSPGFALFLLHQLILTLAVV